MALYVYTVRTLIPFGLVLMWVTLVVQGSSTSLSDLNYLYEHLFPTSRYCMSLKFKSTFYSFLFWRSYFIFCVHFLIYSLMYKCHNEVLVLQSDEIC